MQGYGAKPFAAGAEVELVAIRVYEKVEGASATAQPHCHGSSSSSSSSNDGRHAAGAGDDGDHQVSRLLA
jgi:hypothetical protein